MNVDPVSALFYYLLSVWPKLHLVLRIPTIISEPRRHDFSCAVQGPLATTMDRFREPLNDLPPTPRREEGERNRTAPRLIQLRTPSLPPLTREGSSRVHSVMGEEREMILLVLVKDRAANPCSPCRLLTLDVPLQRKLLRTLHLLAVRFEQPVVEERLEALRR